MTRISKRAITTTGRKSPPAENTNTPPSEQKHTHPDSIAAYAKPIHTRYIAPPGAPSSSATQEIATTSTSLGHTLLEGLFANQSAKASEAIESILKGYDFVIPKEVDLFGAIHFEPKVSAPERSRRHAGLLVGAHLSCKGTNEISGWISQVLRRVLSLGIPEAKSEQEKSIINQKYASLERKLENLQLYRAACRHINVTANLYSEHSHDRWTPAMYRCTASAIQELRKWGRVVVPCDFFLYETNNRQATDAGQEQVFNSAHATSIIIEPTKTNKVFKLHHFETNGVNRHKIKIDSVTAARSTGRSEIDRSRKFSPTYFSASDFFGNEPTIGHNTHESPKCFLRKTYFINLQSIHPNPTDEEVLNDLTKITIIMFPLFGNPPNNFNDSFHLVEQKLTAVSIQEAIFETQRLHARQKTGSCELKSTTVAAAYLLDNEVAYQHLILSLIQSVRSDNSLIGNKIIEPAIKTALMIDEFEVQKKLDLARRLAKY